MVSARLKLGFNREVLHKINFVYNLCQQTYFVCTEMFRLVVILSERVRINSTLFANDF